MTEGQTPRWLRRTVSAGLLGGLLWVGFVVMRPFVVAIAWAAILTYVSWPLHLRLPLPGKFSGLQLLAIMYTAFRQIDPTMDTGADFSAEYQAALQMQKS